MTTDTATEPAPATAATPWLIATGSPRDRGVHAVAWDAADRAAGDPATAGTACGQVARPVRKWGEFRRGNRWLTTFRPCAFCAWRVAVDQGRGAEELAALRPDDRDLAVLTRALTNPLITVRLCEAIIAVDGANLDPDCPSVFQLLAAATDHGPVCTVPEECVEGGCGHQPDDDYDPDRAWLCPWPDADVACPTCSVRAGDWAGEWEGAFTVPVSAPCSVLVTLAETYSVNPGHRIVDPPRPSS